MPSRRLRCSSSLRTAQANRTRRPAGDSGVLRRGFEPGLGVPDRGAGDRERLRVAEQRLALAPGERAQVEVVHDLAEQVVEVLDQPGPGVGVTRDAERAEHHAAELVGGRDRRRVEPGQGLGDPPVPETALVVVAVEEERDQVRGLRRREGRVVGESTLGLDQLGPHPLPQLLAGRPAEGHHEHLVEQAHPLGDVPGDQGADGPGLAGAGAGLEQRRAGRERVADVEVVRRHSAQATRSPPVSSGSHTCQAYVGRPASTSTDSGACSP